MKIQIRKIESVDLKNGFLETLKSLSEVNLSYKKAKQIFSKIKKNDMYRIFVAVINNKIIGATTLLIEQKFIHSGGKVAHVEDVVVHKAYQGKGIGKMLIKIAIKEAKKEKCYKMLLDCCDKNIDFYKKFGFKVHEKCMRLDLI
ncbi:histone acetyltransferase [Candidatus Pacearchaeota archaeon CG_4_9_14_3_um_filter_31_7]|nr:MAG: histone acetyltransferase [Candidatus Pacearchaeota archaeon CG_4_9_14_3_um_filter_31_7]